MTLGVYLQTLPCISHRKVLDTMSYFQLQVSELLPIFYTWNNIVVGPFIFMALHGFHYETMLGKTWSLKVVNEVALVPLI